MGRALGSAPCHPLCMQEVSRGSNISGCTDSDEWPGQLITGFDGNDRKTENMESRVEVGDRCMGVVVACQGLRVAC